MRGKLLYKEIMEHIKSRVLNGEIKPNELIASEIELAKEFQVSRITAKKALNDLENEGFLYRIKGKGSFLSENISLSEVKNESNSAMENIIALILPYENSMGKGMDLISGANEYLENSGYHLIVKNSMFDSVREREMILSLYKSKIGGIIYFPASERKNLDIINTLSLNGFPLVTIDRSYEGSSVASIESDNFGGAYKATSHLIDKGHRNIAYIADVGLDYTNILKARFLGYCQALKDNNINISMENYVLEYITDIKINHPDIYQLILKTMPLNKAGIEYFKKILNGFLDRSQPVTAIHTLNDNVAIFIMSTALATGVRIPEDLSIVGFDNMKVAQHLEVPLTTIDQDYYQMGYLAAKVLLDKGSKKDGEQINMVLPVKLIERASVIHYLDKSKKSAV